MFLFAPQIDLPSPRILSNSAPKYPFQNVCSVFQIQKLILGQFAISIAQEGNLGHCCDGQSDVVGSELTSLVKISQTLLYAFESSPYISTIIFLTFLRDRIQGYPFTSLHNRLAGTFKNTYEEVIQRNISSKSFFAWTKSPSNFFQSTMMLWILTSPGIFCPTVLPFPSIYLQS